MVRGFFILFFMLLWLQIRVCAFAVDDPNLGITVNGVTWARFNVATPGTFTANETDHGCHYQWNCATGWHFQKKKAIGICKEGKTMIRWNRSCVMGDTWETDNDPCPTGWRIPEKAEFESLKQYADFQAQVRNYKGVSVLGYVFRVDGQFLFFPASGYREKTGGAPVGLDKTGHYWSSTGDDDATTAAFFSFDYYTYTQCGGSRAVGRTIRCVKR